jgi:predicted RNA binding protein YcfA (HicA-like mRNA interferase family)
LKLPRDVSGATLVKALGRLGYHVTRQTGSHILLTRSGQSGEHHLTVPNHNPIKLGTLNAILRDVAGHLGLSRNELLEKMFG